MVFLYRSNQIESSQHRLHCTNLAVTKTIRIQAKSKIYNHWKDHYLMVVKGISICWVSNFTNPTLLCSTVLLFVNCIPFKTVVLCIFYTRKYKKDLYSPQCNNQKIVPGDQKLKKKIAKIEKYAYRLGEALNKRSPICTHFM